MQLKDAIQEFILECKVRRLVPRTIDNYGKHLRYLTNYLAEECQLEKLEDIKSAHIKKFLLMKEEQGCKPHYINDLLKVFKESSKLHLNVISLHLSLFQQEIQLDLY